MLAYGINQLLMGKYELPRLPAMYLPVGAVVLWLLGQLSVLGPARRAAAVPPAVATRSVITPSRPTQEAACMPVRLANLLLMPLLAAATHAAEVPPGPSDEFDSKTSLTSWSRFETANGWPDHLRRLDVVEGMLEIEPWTSGWYAEFHAPFLYREISGDFLVTTRIAANGLATEVPTSAWSLAGLMVREPRRVAPADWQPRAENWLFLTTGRRRSHRSPGVRIQEHGVLALQPQAASRASGLDRTRHRPHRAFVPVAGPPGHPVLAGP